MSTLDNTLNTPTLIQCLADHMESLAREPLYSTLHEKIVLCLTDHLAAVLSAHGGSVDMAGRAMLPVFGAGSCTCIGLSQTSSVAGATFYNALIATAEDMDDAHRFASGLHMSATTFPVLFALSEVHVVSGETFMHAAAAGYEVSSRVVRAADAGLRNRGYHSTGVAGVFGACAAACVLLGLEREAVCNALGMAASAGGGLFAFLREGSSVRHAHGAWACVNGLTAALLAQAGFTGPLRGLEGYDAQGRDGYLRAYADTWDETFIRKPGPPEILNAYHKLHAACGHAAPAITALQELRKQLGNTLEALPGISNITIKAYKASAALNNANPRTVAEAKFSLPVLAAIVLVHGQATLHEMTMETMDNPVIRELSAKVRVEEDPAIAADFPRLRACEVVLTLAHGRVLTQRVDAPLGMPENPAGSDMMEAKFRIAASRIFDAPTQNAILHAAHNAANQSPAVLLSLLRKGA